MQITVDELVAQLAESEEFTRQHAQTLALVMELRQRCKERRAAAEAKQSIKRTAKRN